MKRIYILLISALMAWTNASAQQVNFGPLHSPDSPREDWLLPGDTILQNGKQMVYSGKPVKNTYSLMNNSQDGINDFQGKSEKSTDYYDNPISNLTYEGLENDGGYGWNGYGWNGFGWGLHKGLNLSVDLSVFATFGKHAPHWGGLTQNINATYLTPVTKDNKLWMALGAYVNNVNYGSDSYHDGGVYGILGYKFDEHWEAYVYGQVSVANNYNSIYNRYAGYSPYGGYGRWGYGMYPGLWGMGVMPGGYGMGAAGANVLGAGVKYTSKNFSIGINVEGNWYNQNQPAYFKQYDYPVPEPNKK